MKGEVSQFEEKKKKEEKKKREEEKRKNSFLFVKRKFIEYIKSYYTGGIEVLTCRKIDALNC